MKRLHKHGKRPALLLALALLLLLVPALSLTGCQSGGSVQDSGDPDYEAMTITIEGLDGGDKEISVAELRQLPQHDLDASYKRTTGLYEEFKMSGPYLKDVIEAVGGNLDDFEGVGVTGSDAYYCLVSKEVIDATPDLMLALVIDGEAKLDDDNKPARLAVQGQFGPYWVKLVEKITLYKEIPEKDISSVWVFDNLAEGIEPYEYEYYGSKDASIELEQVFSRLDHVDSKAFFTMKSSDGFKKNEALNMVKSRYYIKVEGEDAPTNISPYIKLGMNVQHIAWFSTNADAAVFPDELMKYITKKTVTGQEGMPLDEILYETEVKEVKGQTFDVLGVGGEKVTVPGEDLAKGILVPAEGGAKVVWEPETGYQNIEDLMRIRRVGDGSSDAVNPKEPGQEENSGQAEDSKSDGSKGAADKGSSKNASKSASASAAGSTGANGNAAASYTKGPSEDTILTITGNGVENTLYLSLDDLKSMKKGYVEQVFSAVNNWPTKKFIVGKGIRVDYLLDLAGVKGSAKSVRIDSSDGYYANLTMSQLTETRYRYPKLLSGSAAGAVSVKPMVCWAYKEDSDQLSDARACDLWFAIGQKGLNEVNTAVGVQKTAKITVSTDSPGSWPKVTFTAEGGKVTFHHDFMDKVKIYYTLDGSAPTLDSAVYNPSTTYFQPDLIKPVETSSPQTIKAKVVGFGKNDSEVAVYEN